MRQHVCCSLALLLMAGGGLPRTGPAEAVGERALTMGFADEAEPVRLLSEFLDTIALPLSNEPARWLP